MSKCNFPLLCGSIERKLINIIAVLLILLPIVAGFVYLLVFSVNVPYYDQWVNDIPLSIKFHSGEGTVSDVLHVDNNHRPVITNILLPILYNVTNFNMLIAVLLSYFIYVVSFFMLSTLIVKKYGFNTRTSLLLIPLSFFYFNFYMVCSLLWPGMGMYFVFMPFFVILTFYALEQSTHFDHWFCIAIVSAICCFFTFSGGIFIWIGILAYLVLKYAMNRKLKIIATCASAGLIAILNYFVFQPPIGTSSANSELITQWISYPLQLLTQFTSVVGTNIIHHPEFTLFTGGIILLLLFSVMYTNKHFLDFNETAVWYGLIIYGCATMAALVFLRGRFGDFVLNPMIHHSTSTLFLLVGLLSLAYYYFSKARTGRTKTEKSQNNHDIQLILLTMISCMMIFGAVFHLFPGVEAGYDWFNAQSSGVEILYVDEIDDAKLDEFFYNTQFDGFIPDYFVFFGKDGLKMHLHPKITYFKENQLNLYDPAQNLHFDGIWNDIRWILSNVIEVKYRDPEFMHGQRAIRNVMLEQRIIRNF